MNTRALITVSELRHTFDYDAEKGRFAWAIARRHAVVGDEPGYVHYSGYRRIKINGRSYAAHRLVWLYVHGEWPTSTIDHIDGDRLNNRIANLRDVSIALNNQNRRRAAHNKTRGPLGTKFDKRWNQWSAAIRVNGRSLFLGNCDSAEAAHQLYLAAKRRMHPASTI